MLLVHILFARKALIPFPFHRSIRHPGYFSYSFTSACRLIFSLPQLIEPPVSGSGSFHGNASAGNHPEPHSRKAVDQVPITFHPSAKANDQRSTVAICSSVAVIQHMMRGRPVEVGSRVSGGYHWLQASGNLYRLSFGIFFFVVVITS